jgi:hypothetical protein
MVPRWELTGLACFIGLGDQIDGGGGDQAVSAGGMTPGAKRQR